MTASCWSQEALDPCVCSTSDSIMGHLVKQAVEKSTIRSTSFPAWKSCMSSLILLIRPKELGFTWATTFEAMLFRSYDDVFCILHDVTDDNMRRSCTSCRRHLWRKLVRAFLKGSILKDRCDECGSPIFRHSAATEWGVEIIGRHILRQNFSSSHFF